MHAPLYASVAYESTCCGHVHCNTSCNSRAGARGRKVDARGIYIYIYIYIQTWLRIVQNQNFTQFLDHVQSLFEGGGRLGATEQQSEGAAARPSQRHLLRAVLPVINSLITVCEGFLSFFNLSRKAYKFLITLLFSLILRGLDPSGF